MSKMIARVTRNIGEVLLWFSRLRGWDVDKKVLVIRTDAMGDVILFADAFRYIAGAFPKFKISVVVDTDNALLLADCPWIDEIIPINVNELKRNPIKRHLFLLSIYMKKFVLCLNPIYSETDDRFNDEIALWTGAPERVGWLNGKVYNHEVFYPTSIVSRYHELINNRKFLTDIGADVWSLTPEVFPLDYRPLFNYPYVVVVEDSGAEYRTWPVHKLSELILWITDNTPLDVIVTGKHPLEGPNTWLGGRVTNMSGRQNLSDLMRTIRHAEFVVGSETGPIHMASAFGVPSVCITGGGHYGRFVPYPESTDYISPIVVHRYMECYNCNWNCIYSESPRPCINEITVEDVICTLRKNFKRYMKR